MAYKNKFGYGYIILGLLILAIGVCFIAFSNSLEVLSIVMGSILSLFAVVFGVFTLAKRDRLTGFALKIILAIICLCCGIVTIIFYSGAASVIANIFCLLLIVDGSFKLQTAILSKRYRVFGWWFILSLSCIIIVSSFLLAKLDGAESGTQTVILGIILLIDGTANTFSSIYTSVNDKKAINSAINDANGEKNEG